MFAGMSARMFNWSASRPSRQPDRIIATLGIKKGAHVGDLGSGGGYYALRFARETGSEGRVFAIDVNPEFLRFVASNAKKAGLKNITIVAVPEMVACIPAGSLDLLFSRDVYHHLPDRADYFKTLAKFFNPQGRVAIIDWLPGASRFAGPPSGHRTSPVAIVQEMEAAGFSLISRHDFLKGQSFMIFGLRAF